MVVGVLGRNSIGVFSRRMTEIPNLAVFLGAERILVRPGARRASDIHAVAGWGHKPTADQARAFAARHNLPYLAVEDGFLRSLNLGASGATPLSLGGDARGVY